MSVTQNTRVATVLAVASVAAFALWYVPGSRLGAQEDPHAYFNSLIRRPEHWRSYSFREAAQVGTRWVTYNPAADSRPNRQDAAKVIIPAFRPGTVQLVESVNASATTLAVNDAYALQPRRTLKIDNEIMPIVSRSGNTVTVTRGGFGTAPASHAGGAEISLATNSLPAQVRVPLGTEDGHDYLFVWDSYWTDSFLRAGRFNHKAFQFSSGGRDGDTIWLEPHVQYALPTRCDPNAYIGVFTVRFYNRPGGDEEWDLTDGNKLGPSPVGRAPFCIEPNTWVRFFLFIRQRADNYDPVDIWLADERRDPVQVVVSAPVSVRPTGLSPNSIAKFWIEFNSSNDDLHRVDERDLVAYVRNFVALRDVRDPGPFLVRPVPGIPASTRLRAPTRLRIVE